MNVRCPYCHRDHGVTHMVDMAVAPGDSWPPQLPATGRCGRCLRDIVLKFMPVRNHEAGRDE